MQASRRVEKVHSPGFRGHYSRVKTSFYIALFYTTRRQKNNSMAAISASFGAAIRRAAPVHLRVARSRSLTTTVKAAKEVIATDKSAAALGPYSQAIKVRKPFLNPSLSAPPFFTPSPLPPPLSYGPSYCLPYCSPPLRPSTLPPACPGALGRLVDPLGRLIPRRACQVTLFGAAPNRTPNARRRTARS